MPHSRHLRGVLPVFIDPYVFAVLPPGTIPSEQTDGVTPSFIPSSVAQVRFSISLVSVQTVPFHPLPARVTPAASSYLIRLLTSSPLSKSPAHMVRTPIDRTTAIAQGSAIWRMYMKAWGGQIDEPVVAGSYLGALSLIDTLDIAVVPNKVEGVFFSASSVLTLCRLNDMPSSDHCMRSRYSSTGSTTMRSIYSSNSIRIHQRSSCFTPSPLPAGFLPLS